MLVRMVPSRVVLDTNVWISFLIGKRVQRLRSLLAHRQVVVIVAEELLAELTEVVQRPKMARYFAPDKAHELLQYLRLQGEVVNIVSDVQVCRDSKDNFLLALAQDSQADILVTGDQDLLVLGNFRSVRILTPALFEAALLAE